MDAITNSLPALPEVMQQPLFEAERDYWRKHSIALNTGREQDMFAELDASDTYIKLCASVLVCRMHYCYERTEAGQSRCTWHSDPGNLESR